MKHTKEEIETLYGRLSKKAWNELEGSGEDIELSRLKEHVEFGDVYSPTIVYEDEKGRLWVERDESELEGFVWVLPLYIYDKPDEFCYYAHNMETDKVDKVGGELELENFQEINACGIDEFIIYKVNAEAAKALGEHPKSEDFERFEYTIL